MIKELELILGEIYNVMGKIEENQIEQFANMIEKKKRIFIAGEGRTGFSARGFAMRLMHLGYTVFFVGETITPALKEGDIFVGISGSGESVSVVADAKKALQKECQVLVVTSKKEGALAKLGHHKLIIPATVKGDQGDERKSIQLLSSLFDQSVHIVLDAICLLLSKRDRQENDRITQNHW